MKKVLLLTLICIGFVFSQVFQESFDGPVFPPEGWTVYNLEDTIYPPFDRSQWQQDGFGPFTQPGCAFCRKTYAGGSSGNPTIPNDDWLVTPRVFPTDPAAVLTFYYRGFTPHQTESLEVWVSRAGNTPAGFRNPATGYRVDAIGIRTWDYTLRVVSLASYINQPIYIAFRYCARKPNRHGVFLDNVNTEPGYPPVDKVPDVGVIEINSPSAIITPAEFYPSATVKNFGALNATFQTKSFIYNASNQQIYTSTVQVNNLGYNNTADPTFNGVTLAPGMYTIKFKTFLAGDQNPLNDEMTRSFQVLDPTYHDVGVTEIITPYGEVTTTYLQPKVMVKNFGSQPKTFNVKIEIRNSNNNVLAHSDVTTITLPSLVSSELEFPTTWTPVAILYPYQVQAFTQMPDDQNRANDTVTVQAFVPLVDAKVSTIYMPHFTVYEPGQTIIPSALISNRSYTLDPMNIPSRFTIRKNNTTTVYSDNKTTNIGFCDNATVNYASWIADTGTYTVKCSTSLANDNNLGNNTLAKQLFIPYRDVAMIEIVEPNNEFMLQPIIPRAIVQNYGNYFINAPIEMTIKYQGMAFKCDTNYVTMFENCPGMVFFREWTPAEIGNYSITFRQIFPYDMESSNDIISKDFVVISPHVDLAILSIKAPKDSIAAGSQVYPRVRIYNQGDVPVRGAVEATISQLGTREIVYNEIINISTPLLPGQERTLIYPRWEGIQAGNYEVFAEASIPDDTTFENSSKSQIFTAASNIQRDVRVTNIIEPKGRKPLGMVNCMAMVYNSGNSQDPYQLQMKIYRQNRILPVYAPIISGELDPQQSEIVYFPNWASDTGTFTVRCTLLSANQNIISYTFKDTLVKIEQQIQTGWVAQAYLSTNNQPNINHVKDGGALTYVPDKGIYAFQGNKTFNFWFYDIEANTWTQKANLPGSIRAGKGAALCNDGDNRIYAITGNKTRNFYTYDIDQNIWLRLDDVETEFPKPKKFNGGSGLAYIRTDNGDYVYCVKGSNSYEFYAYSVQDQTWQTKAEVDRGPTDRGKVKDGSSITTDGNYFIYLLKAGFNEFCMYDISGNTWTLKEEIQNKPLYKKVGRGSAMAYCVEATAGVPTIYAFKGNSFEFWKHNIITNTWSTRTNIFMFPGMSNNKIGAGGSLVYVEDKNVFYALKGNKTNEFWKYIPNPNPTNDDDDVVASTIQSTMHDNTNNLLNTYLRVHPKITNSAARIFYQVNILQPITIKLYNNNGALVKNVRQPLNSNTGIISLDVNDVSAGVYFIRIKTEENKILEKIVVQK
ncbi:MAG: choice-of-anchor J domain-containing protein [Candidatus Latescibacteria bacterium]|nr:choice-of-anchor J domain-containing protein [Candidatus Latescibacterota bacterium]